jgi:hypothetical protein
MTAVFRIGGTDIVWMRIPDANQEQFEQMKKDFPHFDITLE